MDEPKPDVVVERPELVAVQGGEESIPCVCCHRPAREIILGSRYGLAGPWCLPCWRKFGGREP